MKPALGDVAVRARGLAQHLLDRPALLRLARASGSGVLAGLLEDVGYWPPSAAESSVPSAAQAIERTVEHETSKRLALLARWLGKRIRFFTPLFEVETRDALRIRIRELASGAGGRTSLPTEVQHGWAEPGRLRAAIAGVTDLPELVRVLKRLDSPYAPGLFAGLRSGSDDVRSLEFVLDSTWAERARSSAARMGSSLLDWVEDEIDLQNAWGGLAASSSPFVEGGRRLSRPLCASIAAENDEMTRRLRLDRAFQSGSLAGVFDDGEIRLDALEARARKARIIAARRAARLDPVGAPAILEVVQRLWAERADLRCISWGIAAGLSFDSIADRLVASP